MGKAIFIDFVTLLCAGLWSCLAFMSLWFTTSTRIRDWWPALGTVVLPFVVTGTYLWRGWQLFSWRETFLVPLLPAWLQPWFRPVGSPLLLAIPGVLALALLGPAFVRAMMARAAQPSTAPAVAPRDNRKRRRDRH